MTMKSVSNLNKCALASSIVGLALSVYSYYIEIKLEHDRNYQPMCDISEQISCSKAFISEYGKGFGVVKYLVGEDSVLNQPNCLLGIVFYSVLVVLRNINSIAWTKVVLGLNTISVLLSLYLAYILVFILHDICVVCVSVYVVNFINLLISVAKLRRLQSPKASSNKKKTKRKKN